MPRKSRATRVRTTHRTVRPSPREPDVALSLGAGPISPSYIPPEATAHAICRVCGRILRVSIPHEEIATLHAFSDRRPDGWTVEGMSFSFTGLCPQCRQGRNE